MTEWYELLNEAAGWLETRWCREIGASAWVSENQLYQLLKHQLAELEVLQHAQPTWLAPQHLDIYIPQASIAVEYMGRQHDEPIEFFGGEAGFRKLQERDRRKLIACEGRGVDLHLVRFDEAPGERAKQIADVVRRRMETERLSAARDHQTDPVPGGQ